jgi:hypothetical protein
MISLAKEKEKEYQLAFEKYKKEEKEYQLALEKCKTEENYTNSPIGPKPTPPPKYFFFVFAGRPEKFDITLNHTIENTLLRAIGEKLKNTEIPENLNIVPFTFQSDTELAPLRARSDATLTRSGGLTSMELLHLNRDEKRLTLIHSEGLKKQDAFCVIKFKSKFEAIVAFIFLAILQILNSLGWETEDYMPILDPEIREPLIKKLTQEYPDIPKEQFEHILTNPKDTELNKKMMKNILKRIYSDPLVKEDKLITYLFEQLLLKLSDKKSIFDDEQLREMAIEQFLIKIGIPLWEGGNARYLKQHLKAHIISPHHCKKILRKNFFNLTYN